MTCKRVEWQIADWVAGRLSERDAQSVAEHCRTCARCASLAADERSLRARFAAVRTEDRQIDLWPAVAVRSSGWSPVRRVSWARRLVVASSLAAVCLGAVLAVGNRMHSSPQQGAVVVAPAVDEAEAVRLVADTRRLPDVDTDAMIIEARYTAPVAPHGSGE